MARMRHLHVPFLFPLFLHFTLATYSTEQDITALNARIKQFLADTSAVQDGASLSTDARHQQLAPNDAVFGPPTKTNGAGGATDGGTDCPGTNCGQTAGGAVYPAPTPSASAPYPSNPSTPLPTPGSYPSGQSGSGANPSPAGPSNTYYIKAIGELWPGSLANAGGSGAYPTASPLGNYPAPPPNSPSRGGGSYPAPVAPTDYVAPVTSVAPIVSTGGYAQTTTTATQCFCPCPAPSGQYGSSAGKLLQTRTQAESVRKVDFH